MEKVAIPKLGELVAPRFEAARCIQIVTVKDGKIVESNTIDCNVAEDYQRVRLLQIHRVSVLICNGINTSIKDILAATGIKVIEKYSGNTEDLIQDYLQGNVISIAKTSTTAASPPDILHENLIERARHLFEANGFQVVSGPGPEAFLIDLIAEMECPVCNLPIRVAICCAAHTYRADQEITEFHHATRSGYNARAYVSPHQSSIWKCCEEYGIKAIDANMEPDLEIQQEPTAIPLLSGRIEGHEKLF